jgi:hypothetical protein
VEKNTTIVFPLPMELLSLLNKIGTAATAPAPVIKRPETSV